MYRLYILAGLFTVFCWFSGLLSFNSGYICGNCEHPWEK